MRQYHRYKTIQKLFYIAISALLLISCNSKNQVIENENNNSTTITNSIRFKSGYSGVNGINMYYEIYGQGEPLVLIHGGGSTIQSTFERIIPQLAEHYQ